MIRLSKDAAGLRRIALWSLVLGLSGAALVAIAALLSGSFDDSDWRVLGTSLGFSVFASTAAAGGALRLLHTRWALALGQVTVLSSAAAFGLLVASLWLGDRWEDLWRAFAVVALAALWTSHASLVLRARRDFDAPMVRWLTILSVVTLGVETAGAAMGVLGWFDGIDEEPLVRGSAVLLVVTLLSTALPPLLRRLGRLGAEPVDEHPRRRILETTEHPAHFATEVAAVADRLSMMDMPVRAQVEIARLQRLARDAGATSASDGSPSGSAGFDLDRSIAPPLERRTR